MVRGVSPIRTHFLSHICNMFKPSVFPCQPHYFNHSFGWTYSPNVNSLTDAENRPWGCQGGRVEGGVELRLELVDVSQHIQDG